MLSIKHRNTKIRIIIEDSICEIKVHFPWVLEYPKFKTMFDKIKDLEKKYRILETVNIPYLVNSENLNSFNDETKNIKINKPAVQIRGIPYLPIGHGFRILYSTTEQTTPINLVNECTQIFVKAGFQVSDIVVFQSNYAFSRTEKY
jgi:hypothetical protein